jgi:hypothetical protein
VRGICLRCGAETEVQKDHWTEKIARRHVHREHWVPACESCHHLRSEIDRRIGIEGGNVLTPWLLVRGLAAWNRCLAFAGRDIPFSSELLGQLASVGEEIADMIANDLRTGST